MAAQGYAKRNDVLRGGKGWHDLRMVNFYSLYGLMQTVFCSFLTLRAGVVRGYIRLCKAIRSYTHANHSNIKQYNLVYLF